MKRHKTKPMAPKKLQAIQTSRHLHVAAHRHTGHVLPRHTTSYPTLAMIMLVTGVFLFNWTHMVTADQSYSVHASVPGPPPSIAATVDTPADGAQYTSVPVSISGTCPLNTYLGLTRNSFSSGIALCDASGHYQLLTDLFKGVNQLVVYDYSFTDAQGPASNMVTVDYEPSHQSGSTSGGGTTSSGGSSGSSSSATSTSGPTSVKATGQRPYNPTSPGSASLPEPLLLKSNFSFLGYYVGQPASWQLEIEGGHAPYAIDAEWGDGTQKLYSQPRAATIQLQHVYTKTGGYHGSYVVKITATDASGAQTYLQLLAIVSPPPKATAAVGSNGSLGGNTNLSGGINLNHMVGYAWSGYGVVVLMLASFWLGERRELAFLHVRVHPKPRRHA